MSLKKYLSLSFFVLANFPLHSSLDVYRIQILKKDGELHSIGSFHSLDSYNSGCLNRSDNNSSRKDSRTPEFEGEQRNTTPFRPRQESLSSARLPYENLRESLSSLAAELCRESDDYEFIKEYIMENGELLKMSDNETKAVLSFKGKGIIDVSGTLMIGTQRGSVSNKHCTLGYCHFPILGSNDFSLRKIDDPGTVLFLTLKKGIIIYDPAQYRIKRLEP
ncbi:hypothetical protein AGMMS49949_00300 [Alphaproteobacteria bacterium]|nr:hypothetical protein AGMMS49949_00300 [Alphaproteobacteria bacterium]GHS99848.1 hypothetical protein AGMMS50296_8090 [Alphaproteobacteria bacterium]